MIAGISASLSGLLAFGRKLGVAAHNIANVHTDGFKKSRLQHIESAPPGNGVVTRVQEIVTPGPTWYEDTPQGSQSVEQSNVDLGEEMVEMLVARRGFQANLRALQAQDELLGSVSNPGA